MYAPSALFPREGTPSFYLVFRCLSSAFPFVFLFCLCYTLRQQLLFGIWLCNLKLRTEYYSMFSTHMFLYFIFIHPGRKEEHSRLNVPLTFCWILCLVRAHESNSWMLWLPNGFLSSFLFLRRTYRYVDICSVSSDKAASGPNWCDYILSTKFSSQQCFITECNSIRRCDPKHSKKKKLENKQFEAYVVSLFVNLL